MHHRLPCPEILGVPVPLGLLHPGNGFANPVRSDQLDDLTYEVN